MTHTGWMRRGAVLLLAGMLAGCEFLGITQRTPVPPCPPILVLRDASTLTRYAPGPGRDFTDMDHQVAIADFRGVCTYNRALTRVDIELTTMFSVERGPANRDRTAAFEYFVAIPHFHPAPEGKKTLPMSVSFEGNVDRQRPTDEVRLRIPLPGSGRLSDYTVYLGLQLTEEELRENQRRGRP